MTKIAILEDDAAIHQMYRMKFENDGFEVYLASDGKSGVEIVKNHRPDIILLDLQMPEVDGVTALKEIRKHEWGKRIPVIVLTNLGQQESPKEIRDLGVSDYIVKAEFTPRQVVTKVKSVLESNS